MAVTAQPVTSPNGQPLVAAQHISKTYGEEKSQVLVLKDVNLEIRPGEFIALLGPSGSGKSTLLRILAGLLPPSSGQVLVHGQPLRGTNPSVAMVFQSFALLPWLTVLDNVELGLLPQAFSPDGRRRRAKAAIELIGLHGFENAYPREISGGMKQRVGFARALVVEPELLMLDEPFSALDVLVADTLRRELADLWQGHKIPTRAILMVTHNIPAHIQLVDSIYQIMTNPKEDAEQLLAGARPAEGVVSPREGHLPAATISGLTGFLHRLLALGGREDLHDLARDLRMGADHLLPLVDAANLLDLVDLAQGDVVLTAEGRRFAEASPAARRKLFRQQALANVELLGQIAKQLEAAPDHRLKDDRLLDLLEQSFSPVEARRKLLTAINWGRYAGLFTYTNGTFRLAAAPH